MHLERGQARFGDNVVFKIKDALDILEGHIKKRANAARQRFQKPYMCDGSGKFDMPHTFTTNT